MTRALWVTSVFLLAHSDQALGQGNTAPPPSPIERAEELFSKRDYAAAAEAFAAITMADPRNGRAWHRLGYCLHVLGRLDEALTAHQKTAEFPELRGTGCYNAACAYALKGNADEAFKWLGQCVEAGFNNLGLLEHDEDLKSLRGDARYAPLRDRVAAAAKAADTQRKKVAVVVHDGVELLDFAGPAEVFSHAEVDGQGRYQVFTVAPKRELISTPQGVRVMPDYAFDDCPKPDILVIPGGDTRVLTGNSAAMAWIARTVPQTEVTLTVCTGAFTLAEQGLLDGLEATTHYSAIDAAARILEDQGADDVRFCDNGRIVTTAGISAGIDGALHVVQRLCGEASARQAARGMQYLWRPGSAADAATR